MVADGVVAGGVVERVVERVVELAHRTPAWTECHRSILTRLAGSAPELSAMISAAQQTLDHLSQACPQVVDVDVPNIALQRAEWRDGSLLLTVHAAEPDPTKITTLRLVGAEPRLWYLTGIVGATTDVGQHSMLVMFPAVSGVLEFVPGSY